MVVCWVRELFCVFFLIGVLYLGYTTWLKMPPPCCKEVSIVLSPKAKQFLERVPYLPNVPDIYDTLSIVLPLWTNEFQERTGHEI